MNYLLWINIYLIIFYGFYWIFLRKTTFFQLKRFYLLLAGVLPFLLPLLTLGQSSGSQNSILLAAVTVGQRMNQAVEVTQHSTSTSDMIALFYIMGLIGSLCWLTVRSLMTRRSIKTGANQTAFSFFNQIVLDPKIEGYDRILVHERTHANELHSIDVLLFEAIKIVNWFNPISYLMTKSAKLNHEYIADQKSVSSSEDKMEYAHLLLSNALATNTHTLTNNFFNKSILKPRIAMLFKNKSKKTALTSFTLLIPILALVVACQSSTDNGSVKDDSTPAVTEFEGQKVDPVDSTTVFTAVEEPPSPNGGMEKFYQHIGDNYTYPEAATKNKVEGRLLLQFVVEKDGSLSDINVLQDLKYGTGEEAVRVLKNSPKWKPGIQNGKPVRVQYTLPIQLNQVN